MAQAQTKLNVLSGSFLHRIPDKLAHSTFHPYTIDSVVEALGTHLAEESGAEARRLGILAVYSLFSHLMNVGCYRDKFLLPHQDPEGLKTLLHKAGDIAISDDNGDLFDCITVIAEGPSLPPAVEQAIHTALAFQPRRMHLLTLTEMHQTDRPWIEALTERTQQAGQCELIVDGMLQTLKYYLRLPNEPEGFVAAYTEALQADFAANTDLKETHLRRWNEILTALDHREQEAYRCVMTRISKPFSRPPMAARPLRAATVSFLTSR